MTCDVVNLTEHRRTSDAPLTAVALYQQGEVLVDTIWLCLRSAVLLRLIVYRLLGKAAACCVGQLSAGQNRNIKAIDKLCENVAKLTSLGTMLTNPNCWHGSTEST